LGFSFFFSITKQTTFVYKLHKVILFINSSGLLLDERLYVNVITLTLSLTFQNSSVVFVLPSVSVSPIKTKQTSKPAGHTLLRNHAGHPGPFSSLFKIVQALSVLTH